MVDKAALVANPGGKDEMLAELKRTLNKHLNALTLEDITYDS